ncbi:MAG: transcription-repair coupling factor [Opitutales bacterium]
MKPVVLPEAVRAQKLTGVPEAAAGYVAARLLERHQAPVSILVAASTRQLEGWAEDVLFFSTEGTPKEKAPSAPYEAHLLPEHLDAEEDDPRLFELECDRLAAVTALRQRIEDAETHRPLILAGTPRALVQKLPSPETLARQELRLKAGEALSPPDLAEKLAAQLGYENEVLCESPGQFALRGGLLDVYPLNATAPVRIDFFGTEIESIKKYDPTSQRSGESVEELVIAAAEASLTSGDSASLADYLPETVNWLVLEPGDCEDAFSDLFSEPEKFAPAAATFGHLVRARQDKASDHWFSLVEIETTSRLFESHKTEREIPAESLEAYRSGENGKRLIGVERVESEQRSRREFLKQVLQWQEDGEHILMITRTPGEEERMRELLDEDAALKALKPVFRRGALNHGFRIRFSDTDEDFSRNGSAGLVALTDTEVFGRKRRRATGLRQRALPQRSQVDQLLDFSELHDGDYLVHLQHGVCIFRGLQKLEAHDGVEEEVISVEFAEKVTLHVRLHEAHLLSRYVGLSKIAPKLGKLGTSSWEKTRKAAERATFDFAGQLLSLQAERETKPGIAFSQDTHWQKEFEAAFPFQETKGQLTSIEEGKTDMEKAQPMDRLLCGDVGFGKTEVALRLAFKAVMDGHQVAVLVPTTVLTQQHFNTFRERMADYPIVVEMLSRFRKPAERKRIQEQLTSGQIDIVVGTHSLLGKDVRFANLGLLVIDEEHRFGVRQKEKIKGLRESVDVLSMSATPIPRTLHFALMGLRDLSVIETAPRDRLPIQTVVKQYEPDFVKEVIRYEINRGGQVFYLHNRVQTIEDVASNLRELLPDLRIGIGHGQMSEGELEDIMTRFVAGQFDVLVCTTIIESGLDIPNCNTLIIEGADRFGLSQLYQLRGRVGRFNKQAYAYLLLHRHARLLDHARKRLNALRQHNQLGAGFRIAMRDLELRGAGNLLGSEQSGHIAGVGFELYCQLLRQSIAQLKGERKGFAIRANVRLDFVNVGESLEADTADEANPDHDTKVGFGALKEAEMKTERIEKIDACIPANYINEARLRIDAYRRFAMAATLEEVDEAAAALRERFGRLPAQVEALIRTTEIRILAQTKGITSVESDGSRLLCRRASREKNDFLKTGSRFPRLTAEEPMARLIEIKDFLKNQSDRFQ